MTHRYSPLLVPAALAAAALIGCSPAPVKVAPTELDLSDYAIAAPATIPASMASFNVVNKGQEAHQAGLARLDSGKTYADFEAVIKDTSRKGPAPAWITWMGGAHAMPGALSEFSVNLQPGSYVWYCMIPGPDGVPHFMKGMSAPMTVTASTGPAAAAPVSDIDVVTKDYQWDMSKPVTSGKHTLKVSVAAGSQVHELALVKLAPGKTAQDFVAWTDKMTGPPPIEALTGIGSMQSGQENYLAYDFKPGTYALVCFVPDKSDGKPHFMHGMVKEFAVQ